MKHIVCAVLATLGLAVSSGPARSDEQPAPGEQRPMQLAAPEGREIGYWLYLPRDYSEKDSWPLMLFLHGAGERGDDLELVKKHGPPKLIAEGKQFPFIVVSPQCPKNQRWDIEALSALLDHLEKNYKVDRQRIYLTGLSMGGYGTWALAAHSPDRFAAIAPICGGGDPGAAKRLAGLPAWVFHGAKDQVVPLRRSQEMVDALEAGRDVRLTVYPEAGHDSWTETYNSPEFYEWLLNQTRRMTRP